ASVAGGGPPTTSNSNMVSYLTSGGTNRATMSNTKGEAEQAQVKAEAERARQEKETQLTTVATLIKTKGYKEPNANLLMKNIPDPLVNYRPPAQSTTTSFLTVPREKK